MDVMTLVTSTHVTDMGQKYTGCSKIPGIGCMINSCMSIVWCISLSEHIIGDSKYKVIYNLKIFIFCI